MTANKQEVTDRRVVKTIRDPGARIPEKFEQGQKGVFRGIIRVVLKCIYIFANLNLNSRPIC